MGNPGKPKRRLYRKKRWWLAGLLWLSVAYPASVGPLTYLKARGRCPALILGAAQQFYAPVREACHRWPAVGTIAQVYEGWWWQLGKAHASAD